MITQVADEQIAPPDSSDIVGDISREVSETGRLLASGDIGGAFGRFFEGAQGLIGEFLPALLSAVFVFLVFYLGYRVVAKLLETSLTRSSHVDAGLQALILKSSRLAAWLFIIVMVLAQFGIDVTALLAGLSIAGIAVGFAARDTLENFISGLAIMLDRPFRVGDYIQVGGVYGCVAEITLRSTRLRTLNDEVMVMPNLSMINQSVINHSLLDTLRLEIPFGIAYKEFPEQARKAVLALFEGDSRLVSGLPPSVVVSKMGDSSVDMVARFHIADPSLEVPMRFEYIEKVREALRDADIEIPFPHLQLHIDGAEGLKNTALGD